MSEEIVPNTFDLSQLPNAAVVDDAEDAGMIGNLNLPGYATVNDQKVLKSVKDVFHGFDYDAGGGVFASAEDVATYMMNTMESIRKVREKADALHILQRAAALARFWYLGDTLDKTLEGSNYGTNAISRLAASLKMSQTYIYQVRAVAKRLNVVDCYLLGIRGVETSHLRKLAQIKDDTTRRAILTAFIEGYNTTKDPEAAERAKKQFIAALNSSQKLNAIDVTNTDPGQEEEEEDEYPECTATVRELNKWSKMAEKLGKDEEINNFCTALGDFFVPASMPDAEDRLDAIKELATNTRKTLIAAMENIRNAIAEIDSLQGCQVVSDETT